MDDLFDMFDEDVGDVDSALPMLPRKKDKKMACKEDLKAKGLQYPRTCAECGIGKCKYQHRDREVLEHGAAFRWCLVCQRTVPVQEWNAKHEGVHAPIHPGRSRG